MDIFARAEALMGMNDEAWARHASPWSVYSRFAILPLIALAVWSRIWIGWWALLPLLLTLVLVWWNPRAFAPPGRSDSWASRGTFGERVFLNRKAVPIPDHHCRWAIGLTWASAAGVPVFVYGLWMLDPWATLLGIVVIVGAKTWFVDRMVWLYDEMKDADPDYRRWLEPRALTGDADPGPPG